MGDRAFVNTVLHFCNIVAKHLAKTVDSIV